MHEQVLWCVVEIDVSHYAFIFSKEYIISVQRKNKATLDHSPQWWSFTVTLQLALGESRLTNRSEFSSCDLPTGGWLVPCECDCRSCDCSAALWSSDKAQRHVIVCKPESHKADETIPFKYVRCVTFYFRWKCDNCITIIRCYPVKCFQTWKQRTFTVPIVKGVEVLLYNSQFWTLSVAPVPTLYSNVITNIQCRLTWPVTLLHLCNWLCGEIPMGGAPLI